MKPDPRSSYFDAIADQWDGWHDREELARRFAAELAALGLAPEERVVDVGCGTGNLTLALLAALSPSGRVIGVDISPRMLELARSKVPDPRASFRLTDASALGLPDGSVDRVIYFSVWPHLERPGEVLREARRVLRPGGWVHVWHLLPRGRINHIHSHAGEAVRGDVLASADEVAALLASEGFAVGEVRDGETYLVTARLPEAR